MYFIYSIYTSSSVCTIDMATEADDTMSGRGGVIDSSGASSSNTVT